MPPTDGRPHDLATLLRTRAKTHGSKPAFKFAEREIRYDELDRETDRVAAGLRRSGLRAGDRVAALLFNTPEFLLLWFALAKLRAVLVPLNTALKGEILRYELEDARPAGLVIDRRLWPVYADVRSRSSIAHEWWTGPAEGDEPPSPVAAWSSLAVEGSVADEAPDPWDPAAILYTSGTTGPPRGAVHVHDAVVAQVASAQAALDLRSEDVLWCTADPGSPAATTYGVVAPLVLGATTILDEGDLEADHWYSVLEEEGVSVWYTTPTALRALRRAGPEVARSHDLSRLRFVATTGEPLDPELSAWAVDVFGLPVHDTWWQAETGGIMIASPPSEAVRPGALGRPLPGVDVAVLERNRLGVVTTAPAADPTVAPPGASGELALRTGWPSMFRAYLGDDARYRSRFVDGWYLTGDLARQDEAGYVWFAGRGDDAIDSAGHLVGPYEVESVLLQHPAVAEVGVVGVPDPAVGETVAAFVALRPGIPASTELEDELLGFARRQLGAGTAPRRIAFAKQLPHTDAGEIAHSLLRNTAVTLAQRPNDGPQA